ncbi:MAG: hypothetical protein EHM67_05135 [Hyphomicrobiaceae bacterium]|nr:MAG: hypothetical protein EHM67_05135 [Hyphomicrobiaceae bacterium]
MTHIGENGFSLPHVTEAIVNHVGGNKAGVAGVYNKALYLAERRRPSTCGATTSPPWLPAAPARWWPCANGA